MATADDVPPGETGDMATADEHGGGDTADVIERQAGGGGGGDEDDSDDAYDTDIEIEERQETPFDACGKRSYIRACRQMHVRPVKRVLVALGGSSVQIGRQGFKENQIIALTTALMENTTVTKLSIVENKLGQKACRHLFHALKENLNVVTLILRNCHLCSNFSSMLEDMMDTNRTVQCMDLSENKFGDQDAMCFARIIENSTSLKELNLSHNCFSDAIGNTFGIALGANYRLRTIDLSWNRLRARSCAALCNGLEENVMLTSLGLAMGGLSSAGAAAIAALLTTNSTLRELDVTGNRIDNRGAVLIARAMQDNETLHVLKMSRNPVTCDVILAFLVALERNPHSGLELLDMRTVHIRRDVFARYERLVALRPNFRLVCGEVMKPRSLLRIETI